MSAWSFLIPIEKITRMRSLVRLGRLYSAHPYPPRKLRKCHIRKLQRAWRKGTKHIHRVEQAEVRREQEFMRHG